MGLMMEMGGTAVAVAEGVAAVAMVAADGAGGTMGAKVPGMVEVAVGMEVMTRPGVATGTGVVTGAGEMTGMEAEGDLDLEAVVGVMSCNGGGLWGFGSLSSCSVCSVGKTL